METINKKVSNYELIDTIKSKYGTLARFAKLINMDETKMRSALHRSTAPALEEQQRIRKLVATTDNQPIPTLEITDELREQIRIAIITQYRSQLAFCEHHPQFSQTHISNIINQRVKRKCDRVKELCDILGIETEFENEKHK